jgi:hypothetical protein
MTFILSKRILLLFCKRISTFMPSSKNSLFLKVLYENYHLLSINTTTLSFIKLFQIQFR